MYRRIHVVCLAFVSFCLSAADAPAFKASVIEVKPQHLLVIKATVKPEEIGKKLGEILPKVRKFAESKKLKIVSPPLTKYVKMGDGSFDIEAGMAVSEEAKGEGEIVASKLPGGKAAVTTHFGAYTGLGDAWTKLKQWVADKKLATGEAWEVYASDPTMVKEADVRTDIFIEVKEEKAK